MKSPTLLDQQLIQVLDERRAQHRYRQRPVVHSPAGSRMVCGDHEFLAFSSNDYLGLANHPAVIERLQSAAVERGVGSGASHLVSGHSDYHHQLEQALAAFTGREQALLFSTGYMANLGVVSALLGRGDTVFEDRLNHASLIDAGLLSRAQFKRFRHNDCDHLAQQLTQANTDNPSSRKLVVVDGVFSMDGDLAPLPQMTSLCRDQQAHLLVDDAHGFGVLGNTGGGCAEHFDLSAENLPILIGTLGKAFGTFGAFVAGSDVLIEALIQLARPYIYTTALPPAVAAATLTSLDLIQNESWRRQQLQANIKQFREGAQRLGLPLMDSATPIQPVVLGEDQLVLQVAEQLQEHGVRVGAIRPPTVPKGTARLRITFSAAHTEDDVARLLIALDQTVPLTNRV